MRALPGFEKVLAEIVRQFLLRALLFHSPRRQFPRRFPVAELRRRPVPILYWGGSFLYGLQWLTAQRFHPRFVCSKGLWPRVRRFGTHRRREHQFRRRVLPRKLRREPPPVHDHNAITEREQFRHFRRDEQ